MVGKALFGVLFPFIIDSDRLSYFYNYISKRSIFVLTK